MKKRNIIILVIVLILILIVIFGNFLKRTKQENSKLKIVTSFYPIYIMTLNITNGIDGIEVLNMSEINNGCIHDYTLTTSDLKKIEKADIFIENGKGMESFSDKIVNSNSNIKIIETAQNVTDIIKDEEEINAHLWTSIDNYILQVEEITNKLKELDTDNSNKYSENFEKYKTKLEELKSEYKSKLGNLEGKKVISLNESFSYLFKFVGMEETLIETNHEQSSLSAEKVKEIINQIKQENINVVVIGEKDDDKNARTIENETDIKIYRLKDGMSGDSSLDSYINTMKENLEILVEMEGI